jgi:hypothetical protein
MINPTPQDQEALRPNQSLFDNVTCAQLEWDRVQSEDYAEFTSIPIDPMIIQEEQAFILCWRPTCDIPIDSDSDGETEGSDIVVSPPRSVMSIDSIAENADFIAFDS